MQSNLVIKGLTARNKAITILGGCAKCGAGLRGNLVTGQVKCSFCGCTNDVRVRNGEVLEIELASDCVPTLLPDEINQIAAKGGFLAHVMNV